MNEKEIHPHAHVVNRNARELVLNQKAKTIWMTGLSASGKSTIANFLEDKLNRLGFKTYLLDGDNVRMGLNNNLGFSPEDRKENVRRVSEVCKLFNDAGVIVIACFISPYTEDRAMARTIIGKDYTEVYVKTSLEECENRDPKKLYVKARAGEIKGFTGIDSPYEEPIDPEYVIDTEKLNPDDAALKILYGISDDIVNKKSRV